MIGAALTLALLLGATSETNALTDPPERPRIFKPSKRHIFGTQWSTPLVRRGVFRVVGDSFGTPGVAAKQGVVIVGTGEGELRGYRLGTGELLWSQDIKVPFLGPVTVIDEGDPFAVTTSADGMLMAVEITSGEPRWQTQLDGQSLAPARVAGDRLLVTTVENKVSALSIETGERLWTAGRPKPTQLTVRGHGAATVFGDTVYAGFSDGYVEAYALQDGRVIWSRPLALGTEDFYDSDADPVVVDGTLFVASYPKGVFALRPADGKTVWSVEAPAVTSLYPYGQLILVGSADGYFWGLKQSDGELAYRVTLPQGNASRVAMSGELAIFTSGDAGLVAIRAVNGEPLQATPLLGRPGGSPAVDGEFVAAISTRGYLYVMRRGAAGLITSRTNWGRP